MRHHLTTGAALLALIGGATIALAQSGPPSFDPMPSCRAAARTGIGTVDPEICLRKERAARAELTKRWSEFSASDKSTCVPLSRTGGGAEATYTELLTCLEMTHEARIARGKANVTTGIGTR